MVTDGDASEDEGVSTAARSVSTDPRQAAPSLEGLERVKGIEPSSSAWKAVALPLSYTRGTRSPEARGLAEPKLGAAPSAFALSGFGATAFTRLASKGWWER